MGAEQGEGYTHYVGDFAADGLAPVYRKDGGAVERYVDRHYYLYDHNKDPLYCQQLGSSAFVQQNVFFYKAELHVMATSYLWLISSNDAGATWTDPLMLNEQVRTNLYYLYDHNKDPLYCQQLGSSAFVQQNVFFYKAELHVMATSYLWLISSNDAGATWTDPLMLNEQVRTNLSGGNAAFYGVGPGRGLVTSGGRIVLPCYTFFRGKGDGNASVIYSDDGVT